MPDIIETFEFHDMDQYMESAAETMDVLSIQLQPGALRIRNQVFQLDDITVTHYTSDRRMFQFLSVPPKHVLFVLTPAVVNGCKWCGVDVPGNALAILHPQQEHQALLPTHWESVELLIDDETVIRESLLSETMWRQTLQPQQALFSRQASRIAAFRRKLLRSFQTPEHIADAYDDNIAQTTLKKQIIEELRTILLAIEMDQYQRDPISRSRRYKTFSRAIAFIEDNLAHQLSIQQICDQIGTTPRTLQLTFQELAGVSPFQYVLSRKLHAIQQDLFDPQEAAAPIFQTAQQYGMEHAGRFSQQYKRLFSESPGAAVKRRA